MEEITKEVLKEVFPPRPKDQYFKKYDFGLLLVIGGSDFYSGSPALNALSAFKAGVGMVRILAPKRAADIIASFSPNLASYPLEGQILTKKHLPILIEMTTSAKLVAGGKVAVVLGGGMGRSKETQDLVLAYLEKIDVPTVIDADAIYAVSQKPELISKMPTLITPHLYEFFVLTGRKIDDLELKEKAEAVQAEAERLKTTILLKGQPDIISDGKEVALCYAGTSYMAVGGTGDVLAGICGALMAKGVSPFLAGKAGAFLNGRAGEIAAERLKDSLTATDVIEAIPEVLKEI